MSLTEFLLSDQEGRDAFECSEDGSKNELILPEYVTRYSDQVRVPLLSLKLAHNLISWTIAFYNRPLVTFIFKLHLNLAGLAQWLSFDLYDPGDCGLIPGQDTCPGRGLNPQ